MEQQNKTSQNQKEISEKNTGAQEQNQEEEKKSYQLDENQQQDQQEQQKGKNSEDINTQEDQDQEDQKYLDNQGKDYDYGLLEKLLKQQDIVKPKKNNGQFWVNQPVVQSTDELIKNKESGPIDAIKQVQDIKQDPYRLPDGYDWTEIDLNDQQQLIQVYNLLAENYVEDEDNMFRFNYSPEFLKWALHPPGYHLDWIIGVKVKKNSKIVGFITGIPTNLVLEQQNKIKLAEINFLCVNKKLRNNRLAPVLIKEITRRVNLKDQWQAVYTAGVVVPTPISKARYYHRSLNPKKLIEINFSSLGKNQTMARVIKLYKLPEETNIEGLREMKKRDISGVCKLLNASLQFTDEDIKHFFLPRNEVIYTFVVENEQKQVTDFVSFYYLPSSILNNPKHKNLRAVYSYYNVATSVSMIKLMDNALILAKQLDFDVFNALDIMDNSEFLKELKFSSGDGNLHYYLYNWKLSRQLESKELGMVLV